MSKGLRMETTEIDRTVMAPVTSTCWCPYPWPCCAPHQETVYFSALLNLGRPWALCWPIEVAEATLREFQSLDSRDLATSTLALWELGEQAGRQPRRAC